MPSVVILRVLLEVSVGLVRRWDRRRTYIGYISKEEVERRRARQRHTVVQSSYHFRPGTKGILCSTPVAPIAGHVMFRFGLGIGALNLVVKAPLASQANHEEVRGLVEEVVNKSREEEEGSLHVLDLAPEEKDRVLRGQNMTPCEILPGVQKSGQKAESCPGRNKWWQVRGETMHWQTIQGVLDWVMAGKNMDGARYGMEKSVNGDYGDIIRAGGGCV
ncbi:hypothetical protein PPACK8108_LOCUS6342 [Phakopsora pachyrhizi]|uniref:Uncharacterized protein n=1 Tax=Phakopsora pachyrhizi TaxID=170000 RepID=A0AAV0AQP6_PHAPC|nr:hypothetical protein PPACK8108_LOCUS6342 [Phakopsora pachyrhizi]